MTDTSKCIGCTHLQAPEMRTQWHCLNGEAWTDVDIINRCELSGYPVGCVMADVHCRKSLQSLAVDNVL